MHSHEQLASVLHATDLILREKVGIMVKMKHLLSIGVCVCVAQLCPTLCNPMDYSPPGSFVHGILQARILEWVAISVFKVVKTMNLRVGPSGFKSQLCVLVSLSETWGK